MSQPADSSKKPSRWGNVARLGFAVALFGLVLWIVPIRDGLDWPTRFPEGPLVGQLERAPGQMSLKTADGLVVTLFRESVPGSGEVGKWASATIERSGQPAETVALSPADQAQLEEQPQEGLLTTLRRLRPGPLCIAVVLYILAASISFVRWYILLNAVNVQASLPRALKLGFLGLFFSNIIPGMTGGDLVKAIYVARDHPEQRATAVLSVLVDRAIGLFGLALVGSTVLWFRLREFQEIALWVNGILLLMAFAACMLFSRRLRKQLRLEKILARLPMANLWKTIDNSVLLYRSAGKQIFYSVLLSLGVHSIILTSIGMVGVALGFEIPFVSYYALAPLPLIIQSVPVAPAGIGVGEAAFVYIFSQKAGLVAGQAALALALSYRAIQLGVSLIGGILLLLGGESKISSQGLDSPQGSSESQQPAASSQTTG